MPKSASRLLVLGATLLFVPACRREPSVPAMRAVSIAYCSIKGIGDSATSGLARFTQYEDHTRIEINLQGLSPGKHGIHLHATGDCGDAGRNAGGHFDPEGHAHGMAAMKDSHRGDLGNIVAGKDGKGSLSIDDPYLSLRGPHSALGRSLVVHAGPDDLKTQPAGDSGARIACGIVAAKPD